MKSTLSRCFLFFFQRKTGSGVMQLAITRPHITVFLPYAFIYKCRPVLLRSPAGSTGRDGAVSGSQPAGENRARANGHSPSLTLSLSLSLPPCLFLWVSFTVSPCLCCFHLLYLLLSISLTSFTCLFFSLSFSYTRKLPRISTVKVH